MRSTIRLPFARWLAPGAIGIVAVVAGSTVALAATLSAGSVVRVPDNPLGGSATCAALVASQEKLGSFNNPDAEVEPHIAVDPTNPMHLVGSVQQDRWNDGGSNGLTNVVSTNGGNHWQAPVTARVDASNVVLNDKESVTGDPVSANKAYAVWDRLVSPAENANPSAFTHTIAFRGPTLFSRTTDKGVTWSTGRIIFDPGEKDQTIGNQIMVPTAGAASGVLIDGMSLITNKGGKCLFTHGGQHCAGSQTFTAAIIRSTDGGNTWSDAIGIDVQQVAAVSIPTTPAPTRVRSSDELPEFATNPVNGNIYAVWQDSRFSSTGASKIAFAQSTDGGLTWSNTIRIDQSPGNTPAFVPQIHVASDGTIGLLYYDLENSTAAQPGLTDAFIAHCHSATSDCSSPASWAAGGETRLSTSGSFDYTTAPNANGLFLGDYDGLTSAGTTFKALFAMSKPVATAGASDAFSNSAR